MPSTVAILAGLVDSGHNIIPFEKQDVVGIRPVDIHFIVKIVGGGWL